MQFFSNLRFPTLWCGIKPLDHEDVAQKMFWSCFVPLERSFIWDVQLEMRQLKFLQPNLWASLRLPQFRLSPSMVQPPCLEPRATTDWGGKGRGGGFVWLRAPCVDLEGNSFVRSSVQVMYGDDTGSSWKRGQIAFLLWSHLRIQCARVL